MRSKSIANAPNGLLTHVLPPIAWAACIYALSSSSGTPDLLPSNVPNTDKMAHFVAYGILGFLLARAGRRDWIAGSWQGWALACWAIASLYGAADEWHQFFVPERSCSWIDWFFDVAGAAAGVAWWIARQYPQALEEQAKAHELAEVEFGPESAGQP